MRPEAGQYVGSYVKAIHDFHSDFPIEISLKTGDVLQVTEVVDNNWLHGKLKDKEGNFPTDFVEKLHIPLTEEGQKVFAATENFPAQQDGDLPFKKGDVILGLYAIDESWWQGECGKSTGMFPVTHVLELQVSKLLRSRSKSVHSSEPLFAQALVDSVAQLDEELSFQTGDIITVTEVVDEDWYVGECHGKSGMFLSSCVSLLNEDECSSNATEHKNHSFINSSKSSNTKRDSSVISSNEAQTSTRLSDKHNVSVESFDTADQNSYQSNDASFSSVGNNTNQSLSYTSENTKAHNTDSDAGVTPYARTLYPFVGELQDELSFQANDIVTLIQHVDEQWIEGEVDGKIGVFPANYVEIIVDCPYAYVSDEQEILLADSAVPETDNDIPAKASDNAGVNEQTERQKADLDTKPVIEITGTESEEANAGEIKAFEEHGSENYALVLYTFKAETDQDLNVFEGETVTVIKQVDDNWVLVRNDFGERGMCPCGYVEIIGAAPEFTQKAHDSNDNEIINLKAKAVAVKHADNITDSTVNAQSKIHNDSMKEYSSSNEELKKPTSAIKTSDSSDSISLHVAGDPCQIKQGSSPKPQLKPKPSIAPKPAIKPKPALSPKPLTKVDSSKHNPVTFDFSNNIPKSASTRCLSSSDHSENFGPENGTMVKAQSMFEINETESADVPNTSLSRRKGSDSGSTNSLNSDKRNSSDSRKAFESWDLSKPLDNILQSEFSRAKTEVDARSRSNSNRSSGSLTSSGKSYQDPDMIDSAKVGPSNTSSQAKPYVPNYSRSNFETSDKVNIGNSTFFINDSPSDQRKLPLRKPPPPPVHSSSKVNGEFARTPSLKKAAPTRPIGPRVAPLPSRTPIVPTRTAPSKMVPSRPSTTHAQTVPARPQGLPRKHSRPAPPRPQASFKKTPQTKPKRDDLISFSPTNTSIDVTEQDPQDVQELRVKIADIENDLHDFRKSKSELEQVRETAADDTEEIHDNIQFYDDNIDGFTQELNALRELLASKCPEEKDKIAQEKAAALQKMELEKERDEMKKRLAKERENRKEKRGKVINELIQTERDFISSLNLIMETFLDPTAEKHPDVEVEHLFGNIEEVADVSQRLLTKLEDATQGKDFTEQVIGTCFVSLAEDMKNVYAPYCRNHDDVITLIEKYNQTADIKAYLNKLLDQLREKHVVFDLEALLIKPVQRILKYPLLLSALTKATEDDHPDKKEILAAISAMTGVATAINEYKRRKDLVYKYKKETEVSLGDKLSKLSLHSIKKKSSRIRERFSANLGFIDQTRDSNFDREETRYRHLEKTVKVFLKNVQLYLEQVQDVVSAQESIAADIEDFYGDKRDMPEIDKYQAFINKIHMTFLPNFQVEVDDLVMYPLTQLSQTFEGPNKVIQKRYDKLLDYDNMNRKAQSDKVTDKALQASKQDYEALNAQLLDELPRLYTLAFQLFRDCMGSFVRAQRDFTNHILQDMYEQPGLNFMCEDGIIEVFNINHSSIVDKLAMISFIPRNFSPRMADQKQDKKSKRMSVDSAFPKSSEFYIPQSSEAIPQIDSQRVFVTQQYTPNKLFRVLETYVAIDPMDITVCADDVVGVMMEKDPMGNKERWFVDNGAIKGFIPRKLLTAFETSHPKITPGISGLLQPTAAGSSQLPGQPLHTSGSRQSITNSAILQSLQEEGDMDFALDEDMTPTVPENDDGNPGTSEGYDTVDMSKTDGEDLELYYAAYAFTKRTENEVTMFEHQVVTVISKHDQEGNPEWWYVDTDDSQGYAPASYLRRMDTHGDPT